MLHKAHMHIKYYAVTVYYYATMYTYVIICWLVYDYKMNTYIYTNIHTNILTIVQKADAAHSR